jgi:hypothetical protein
MEYSTWGLLGFWTLSIVRYSKEHNVLETACFHSRVRAWETPTLLGMSEKADLKCWTIYTHTIYIHCIEHNVDYIWTKILPMLPAQ